MNTCYIIKKSRKDVNWLGEEDLGRVWGGKTIINILYKKSMFSIKELKFEKLCISIYMDRSLLCIDREFLTKTYW